MPVSGVLLACQPDQLQVVQEAIDARPLSQARPSIDHHLIVVTDTDTLQADRDEVQALENLDGVISARVVFSSVEDLAEAQ